MSKAFAHSILQQCSTCTCGCMFNIYSISIKTWGIKKVNSIQFKHMLQFLQSEFELQHMLPNSVHVVKLYTIYGTHFLQSHLPSLDSPSIVQSLHGSTPNIWLLTRFYRVGPMSIKHGNHLYLTTQTCLAMQMHSSCQGQWDNISYIYFKCTCNLHNISYKCIILNIWNY
jgi:hypothetical protein